MYRVSESEMGVFFESTSVAKLINILSGNFHLKQKKILYHKIFLIEFSTLKLNPFWDNYMQKNYLIKVFIISFFLFRISK